MRKSISLLGVLVLTAAAPSLAKAAVPTGVETPLCIFWGSYSACASVNINTTLNQVTVKNLSGLSGNTYYKLTGFGFYYFPRAPETPSMDFTVLKSGWSDDLNGISGVLAGESWDGAATTSGVGNAIDYGQSYTFTFTGGIGFDNLYWAWRGQAWQTPGGADVGSTSIKCFQTGEASDQGGELEAYCGPPTVVPEPATMALLATGLVGLGGAGLIRRRRNTV